MVKNHKANRKNAAAAKKKNEAKPNNPSRPMGVSIIPVSCFGTIPECGYCHSPIHRGEWHSIRKNENPDPTKTYAIEKHCHFGCSEELSQKERIQLDRIISNSTKMPGDEKDGAREKVSSAYC